MQRDRTYTLTVSFVVVDAKTRNRAKFIKYVVDEIEIRVINPQWCTIPKHVSNGTKQTGKTRNSRSEDLFPGPWVHHHEVFHNGLMYTGPS